MRPAHLGPLVTIVVPTCDRGNAITKTIQTLVQTDPPPFEIIVVDQSADDATEAALIPFRHARNFRYVRMPARGSSIARNLGIDLAQGELIGLVDDDCEVPVNWVRALVEAFAVDPRIGVVFGNVEPGPHDSKGGFIPAYSRRQPYLAAGMHDKHRVEGMSACMGVRRSVWQSLHGFDSMLGVGRPLQAGAEVDLTIRCLHAGHFVYETPGLTLVHNGFRDWDAGRLLIRRYWYGAGGVYGKHLKRHAPNTCSLLFRLGWRWALGRSRVAQSLGTRPHRMLRLAAFARGFAAGVVTPVDRATGHFASDDKEQGWTDVRFWTPTMTRTPGLTKSDTFSAEATDRSQSSRSPS